jgi:hypothetical protein
MSGDDGLSLRSLDSLALVADERSAKKPELDRRHLLPRNPFDFAR